jgi:hypothetical protein
MTPKHPKITHSSQLSEHSSWRKYKRGLLELEMRCATKEIITDYTKECAKYSFSTYLSITTEDIDPLLNWETYEILGSAFEDIAEGRYPILLVSMPPRTGKSTLGSLFLSWLLGKDPDTNHFVTSYGQSLSRLTANRVKQEVNNPLFEEIFSKIDFEPHRVVPVSSGFPLPGYAYGNTNPDSKVPGVWLIDDYHKSSNITVNKDWIEKEIMTRRHQNSAIVVLGSRWGDEDIFGYFLDKFGVFDPVSNLKGAVHINLSAIIESKEEAEADILGRNVGETLGNANQYPSPENLKDLRRNLGDEKFSWLYKGCSPTPKIPPLDRVIISVDPAFRADSIDKTGICIAGVSKERDYMYVLDTYEGNWDLKTVGVILSLAVKAYGAEEIVLEFGGPSAAWVVYLQDLGLNVCVGRQPRQALIKRFSDMADSRIVKFSNPDIQSTFNECRDPEIVQSDIMSAVLVSYSQLLPTVNQGLWY